MRTKFAILTFASLLAFSPLARSQTLSISTLAGSAGQGSANGAGPAARFANPWGVTVDGSGNLFVADTDNHVIRKITSGGTVTTFAGTPGTSGSSDSGSGLFNSPQGVAVDSSGNVYVCDTGNHTIRKITSGGTVSTLAGTAGLTGTNDATGGSARFYEPEGIVVNSTGTLIYVADTWNHTIRQIASGVVTTLAGSPTNAGFANGTGGAALFNEPQGVALDVAGNIYVGDTGNQMIRMVTAAGVVTTVAGSAGNYGSVDATGASAQFWGPQGIAVDSATNMYVADSFNNAIRKITSAGVVTTYAGTNAAAGGADGTGTAARFTFPQGVAVDGSGNVYVADSGNGAIRKITSGVVTTLAGSASGNAVDATNNIARFYEPASAAIDNSGNTYVADTGNNTIRKITSAGVVTTFAGLAGSPGSADGTSAARFNGPQGVAVDASGTVYVADTANHTIRKITSGGTVSTLAGTVGTNGVVDGNGTAAQFNFPQGVAVDGSGNVYVADTWNHTIRKITSGVVTTLAGFAGYSGDIDSGVAGNGTNAARFYAPSGLALDVAGNLYVADTRNHTIRKVTAAGVVTTLAGLAGSYGSVDASNNVARFFLPQNIAVDASTNIYVVDSGNHTIRKISASGTNWVVVTVAGSADVYGSADGSGASARFFSPLGISINNVSSLVIADFGNNTIRSVGSVLTSAPSITTQPQSLTANQGQNPAFSVVAAGTAPLAYQWLYNGGNLAGGTASSYTVTNAQTGNVGSYSVIVTNSIGSITSSVVTLSIIVPPAITTSPQDLNVNQGDNAPFSVTASGTSPTYQWLYNGGSISGATASSYTLTNAQPANAGSYSVIVTNAAGSVTSTPPAVLTVNSVPTPPGIGTAPQSQTVTQTSNAVFSVVATGSAPFAYQWLFNGGNLSGATATSYTVANAQSANVGSYSVIITNNYGAITSAVATLTVVLPPVISVQPVSQLITVSNSVSFNVQLSQGISPAYQWQKNGANISGATQSSLTINPVIYASAATYIVVVTNTAGSATSSGAVLTVQQKPVTFFDDFESYSAGALDYNITGSPNTSSPWFAFTTSTARGVVQTSTTGVTPHGGSQMVGATGTIRQDYLNIMYRFNAGQIYYGNFMCDWYFYDPSGTNASGATNANEYMALCSDTGISTTSDSSGGAGTVNQRMSLGTFNSTGYNYTNYQCRIIGGITNLIYGNFGSGFSWYNTTTPRSVGWHHARFVVGIPNPALTNSAPVSVYIDNMTNTTVYSAQCSAAGFNVVEMNHALASTASTNWYYDDFTFRAANDPWIVEQPVSLSISNGQPADFNTVAVGTAYQWQFNGANVSGATTSDYSIASVVATNAGSYVCVVTGANGNLSTTAAVLAIAGLAPSIATQPQSVTVTQGQNAAFSVAASGAAPLSYQWQYGNTPISGATTTSYIVTNAQPANVGSYSVVVTNASGSITSSAVTLTVNVPANITTQPQSQTVTLGQNALFTVTAAGTGTLAYQWQFNNAAISGATTTSYTVTNAQPANVGSYSVIVTNNYGGITSSVVSLTVNVPANITTQPQPQTVVQSQNASFSVMAAGTGALAYQWQFNSAPISGATTTSYTVTNAQPANVGSYSVVVTNNYGSITSSIVTLTVNVPANITTQPQPQTVTQGQNASFTVTAAGTGTLAYQWQFNNAAISGATATSYTVTSAQTTNVGSYSVIVTNNYGGITSSIVTLTVNVPASITTPPQDQTVVQGQNAPFTVTAAGTGPLAYQWKFNSGAISGATTSSYTVTNAQPANAGSYTVIVTNAYGTVPSSVATLIVNVPANITAQPQSQTVTQNQNATFSVTAAGTGILAYQWQFNNAVISGATTTSYTVTNAQTTNVGSYSVIVTNNYGSVTSSVVALTVNLPASITAQPQSLSVTQGQDAPFTVTAAGTGTLAYQWKFNNAAISGATTTSYTVTNAQPANVGSYTVIVTNNYGSITSSIATLTISVPVAITNQPQSLALGAGANAFFSVTAGGTGPLSYQWQFNSTPITGATASTYTRTNVQNADVGSYSVVITNAVSSATSTDAILTVNNSPVLTALSNVTVFAGALVTITNSATDSDVPSQTLVYSLVPGAPATAGIDSSTGIFTWQTTTNDANSVHAVTVRVTDNGTPAQSATNLFTISVVGNPTFKGLSLTNNTITLSWGATAGFTYDVQYKTLVTDTNWIDLTNVTATASTASCTDATVDLSGPIPFRFYRVFFAP